MPRKRILAPQFFTHAELYDAEVACRLPLRLAYAALWCQADRRGVFAWRPRELKLACLPYDPVDFEAVLSALESAGFVRRYVVKGRAFGTIPAFLRWQSFHRDERPSDAPGPEEADTDSAPAPGQHHAGTVLAPCQHPSSTPISISTSTSSSTSAATARADASAVVDPTDGAHRAALAAAANKGTTALFGEPALARFRWDQPAAFRLAEALAAESMPLDFAVQAVFTAASERGTAEGTPPRSLKYYASLVVEMWRAHTQARTDGGIPTPDRAARSASDAVSEADQLRAWAVQYAQDGNAEWIAYCEDRGIPWRVA